MKPISDVLTVLCIQMWKFCIYLGIARLNGVAARHNFKSFCVRVLAFVSEKVVLKCNARSHVQQTWIYKTNPCRTKPNQPPRSSLCYVTPLRNEVSYAKWANSSKMTYSFSMSLVIFLFDLFVSMNHENQRTMSNTATVFFQVYFLFCSLYFFTLVLFYNKLDVCMHVAVMMK